MDNIIWTLIIMIHSAGDASLNDGELSHYRSFETEAECLFQMGQHTGALIALDKDARLYKEGAAFSKYVNDAKTYQKGWVYVIRDPAHKEIASYRCMPEGIKS